jgi:hypothetical protein
VIAPGFVYETLPRQTSPTDPECGMTSEEREKMESLCQQITKESDPDRFEELVLALNELLDAKQVESMPPGHSLGRV